MAQARDRHELDRRGHPDRAERASDSEIVAMGQRVLAEEESAIRAVGHSLGEPFATAIRWIYGCEGRVLVTGLGKSGLIARKIAATLTSTGTPALFVHPVEALHGDLGIASPGDLLLALSRSGANEEILTIQSSLRSLGVRCIALSTRSDARLVREADLALVTPVEREACPLDLTPTTSTTAALALGDAIAMTLLELRDFRREDFALFHPSGALGRALRTTVAELMHSGSDMPAVRRGSTLRDALVELSAKRLGCTLVLESDGGLAGFLSDGDLKRILLVDDTALPRPVEDFMSREPRSVAPDCLARAALRSMENNEGGAITQLVVMEGERPVGVVHLHDILRLGFAN